MITLPVQIYALFELCIHCEWDCFSDRSRKGPIFVRPTRKI